jgi:NAD(P)H-dependent nitrite reductase small subunit
MREYVVGKLDEIPDGKGIAVQAGRREVAVFRVGREVFAIANSCPHKGASLCEGEVMKAEKMVRCPWHHWNWQLTDGKLETEPRQGLRKYEVALDGDDVVLRI